MRGCSAPVAFSIEFPRGEGGKSRKIRPFSYPHSRVSRVSRFCLRYDQPTARGNACVSEKFFAAACVTGIGSALLSQRLWFFPPPPFPRGRAFLLFAAMLGMTACGLQSLALIQLYDESLLIKVCLWYRAGAKRDAGGEGRRDDLVGRHGFHAFAMKMRDAGKVENSGPIRGREWKWLAKHAFNEITCHFAAPWCTPGTLKKFWMRSWNCEQLKRSARAKERLNKVMYMEIDTLNRITEHSILREKSQSDISLFLIALVFLFL